MTSRSYFSVLLWRSRVPSDPAFAVPALCLLAGAANLCEGRFRRSRRRGIIVSGRFRARKLVGSGRYSKRFFAAILPRSNASHSCPGLSRKEGARHTIKIGTRRGWRKPGGCKQCRDGRRLPNAQFDDDGAPWSKPDRRGGRNLPIAAKPVGSAIE